MSKANGVARSAEVKVLEKHPPPWRPGPPVIGPDGAQASIIDARGDVVVQFVSLPGSNPGAVASMLANSFDGGESAKIADDLRCCILIGMNARVAGELLSSSFELMESAQKSRVPKLEIAQNVAEAAGRAPPASDADRMAAEALQLQNRAEKGMRNVVLKALQLGMAIGALKPLAAGQFEWVPEQQ